MDLSISFPRWEVFLLVFVRVAAMMTVAPVLSARPIPAQVKIGLSFLLALLLTPMQTDAHVELVGLVNTVIAVAREALVGLLLGFAGAMIFAAVQMAAQIMAVQIGFGFSSIMNPLSPDVSGFLDTFYGLLAVVIFLTLGGHHALIAAVGQSFQVVPVGGYAPQPMVGDRLNALMSMAFASAIRLAMPTVATVMLVDTAMALVVRSIPQMNIFSIGLPIKIVVGFLTLAAVAPMTVAGISDLSRGATAAAIGILR